MKRSSLGWFGLVILLILGGDSQGRSSTVLGKWTIRPHKMSVGDEIVWTGTATAQEERPIQVQMFFHRQKAWGPPGSQSLELPKAGKVIFDVSAAEMEVQQDIRSRRGVLRTFWWEKEGQVIVVISHLSEAQLGLSRERSPAGGKQPTLSVEQRKAAMVEAAMRTLEQDGAIRLLETMAEEKVELFREAVVTGYPQVEASVDGSDFQAIKRSSIFKKADYGWVLPAREGQAVKFRIGIDLRAFVVTTRGIEIATADGALEDHLIRIREYQADDPARRQRGSGWIEESTDGLGTAIIDYGRLRSALLLQLRFDHWRSSDREFRGHIFLRWGRPEEKSGYLYNLTEAPLSSERSDCIRNILGHLERHYDFDRGEFYVQRRDSDTCIPGFADVVAFNGLDLSAYPHLGALKGTLSPKQWIEHVFERTLYGRELPSNSRLEQLVPEIYNALEHPPYGPKLWEDLAQLGKKGWHDPRMVYGLAILWERFAHLRKDNPLKKTLDYWVRAVPERPVPLRHSGKRWVADDTELTSRGYAVAALHYGYEVFGNVEYAGARDAVLKSMRQEPANNEYYKALVSKDAWCLDASFSNYDRTWRDMCNFVSVYGQTCAFVGNEKELNLVRAWIVSALMREGKQRENPFRNYQAATFSQRCGMIAVLRGNAAYLAVPAFQK